MIKHFPLIRSFWISLLICWIGIGCGYEGDTTKAQPDGMEEQPIAGDEPPPSPVEIMPPLHSVEKPVAENTHPLGTLGHNLPDSMDLGEPEKIVLTITQSEMQNAVRKKVESLAAIGGVPTGQEVETALVRLGDSMTAELKDITGSAFEINPIGRDTKALTDTFTSWQWYVKPVKAGDNILALALYIHDKEVDLPVYDKYVHVRAEVYGGSPETTPTPAMWLMIGGGLFLVLGVGFIFWMLRRRRVSDRVNGAVAEVPPGLEGVEELIRRGELEHALKQLQDILLPLDDDLNDQVTLHRSTLSELAKKEQLNLMAEEEIRRGRAQVKYAALKLVDEARELKEKSDS